MSLFLQVRASVLYKTTFDVWHFQLLSSYRYNSHLLQLWLSLLYILALSAFPPLCICLDQHADPCLHCPSASLVTVGRTTLTSHSLCNSINLEQGRLLFIATVQKQRVIQACTSALCVCVCVCVCVTAVLRAYPCKHVCMFMSDSITRKIMRESNKGPQRVRQKYCSNPRAGYCSSGEWCTSS